MFDAERLLGKIVGEMMGGGQGSSGSGSLLGGLASGGGLMTAIGLGVGAFEILRDRQRQEAGTPAAGAPVPPPPPGSTTAPPPPPPPPGAAPPGAAAPPAPPVAQESIDQGKLARRMIRVMIAAAHADGVLDAEEQEAILKRLERADLSGEEKGFLVNELNNPWSIDRLVEGISDPGVAGTMYMLAVSTITLDTEQERDWLDRLARQLGLDDQVRAFIDKQYGTR